MMNKTLMNQTLRLNGDCINENGEKKYLFTQTAFLSINPVEHCSMNGVYCHWMCHSKLFNWKMFTKWHSNVPIVHTQYAVHYKWSQYIRINRIPLNIFTFCICMWKWSKQTKTLNIKPIRWSIGRFSFLFIYRIDSVRHGSKIAKC